MKTFTAVAASYVFHWKNNGRLLLWKIYRNLYVFIHRFTAATLTTSHSHDVYSPLLFNSRQVCLQLKTHYRAGCPCHAGLTLRVKWNQVKPAHVYGKGQKCLVEEMTSQGPVTPAFKTVIFFSKIKNHFNGVSVINKYTQIFCVEFNSGEIWHTNLCSGPKAIHLSNQANYLANWQLSKF